MLDAFRPYGYIRNMSDGHKARLLKISKQLIIIFSMASVILFFYQSIRNYNGFGGNDLSTYALVSGWFFEGDNPYILKARRYIYPLFLLIISYPLSLLQTGFIQKSIAAGAWSLISYASLFWTFSLSQRFSEYSHSIWEFLKKNLLTLSLLIVMLHPFLQDEFLNGQVNLIVLGDIAGFFVMGEKKRPFLAAMFLAAATAIKIGPGLLIVYILLIRQYRTLIYYIPLLFLFILGLPYLFNQNTLEYYNYYAQEVLPALSQAEHDRGFRSFSLISTVSHVFEIKWNYITKIAAVGLTSLLLFIPIFRIIPGNLKKTSGKYRLAALASIMSIIPLTFPMSEPHHLLILTIPFIMILSYWNDLLKSGGSFFRDKLSILFSLSVIGLHVGHGLKDMPIRLICLLGVYIGMLILLYRFRKKSFD